MVFNSLVFLAFFAIVLALHYMPFPWRVKKFNLLVASYLFYAAWNPPFVLLLILSAVVDFWLARRMDRVQSIGGRRLILTASLVLNLGLLGYFKYGSFLLNNFARLLRLIHIDYQPPKLDIILPLGISFYTFETISYLMDVYRRKIKPWDSFLDYALFLTFFPHLVAGPIVRASDFLPQCLTPRWASGRQMGWGLTLLCVGLFEKVILADTILAPVADVVFGAPRTAAFTDAWVGVFAFSGQIFFDFAGYTTCAIGVALCFGFVLNDNFHFPYAAVGFSDFWQRWHMSLSSWLRDYLYIPLGGNRKGRVRTYVNLMVTMLLGGLWHGASARFVVWGGLHGSYLIGERFLKHLGRGIRPAWRSGLGFPLAVVTYLLVCITWVFFRATSFGSAFALLSAMRSPSGYRQLVSQSEVLCVLGVTGLVLGGQWLLRDSSLERVADRLPGWARGLILAFVLVCLAVAPGSNRAFIYFQF